MPSEYTAEVILKMILLHASAAQLKKLCIHIVRAKCARSQLKNMCIQSVRTK